MEYASSSLVWLSIQITASVLVPLYSGFIISYLTISTPKLPFTDLETFVQDGTYKASGIEGLFSHELLKRSLENINNGAGLNLLLNDTPTDEADAINWIFKNNFKYAFACYYYDLSIGNNILKIPEPIFTIKTGIELRYDSPYTEIFKIK